MKNNSQLKILLLDVETAPLVSYTWGLWDQTVALNQIKDDWAIIAFAGKWLDSKEVIYVDNRNQKDIRDDKELLKVAWKLMNEADIIVGQNSKSFDIKKLNARFILNGMKPPSSYKQFDTMRIAKKYFAFTSNKLEYMSDKLCKQYKKLKVTKFPGFNLWSECMKGNQEAWQEMKRYNILDVLSLEELYKKLVPWDNSLNFNLYSRDNSTICTCGSKNFHKNGYFYGAAGKFQRYACSDCGAEIRDKKNLFTKDKKASLKK